MARKLMRHLSASVVAICALLPASGHAQFNGCYPGVCTTSPMPPAIPSYQCNYTAGAFCGGESLTRASTATFFNSSGVLSSAAANAARFDYTGGVARGLLLEQASTNLVFPSAYTAASWTASNGTATANAIASPDGGTAGMSFADTATSSSHFLQINAAVTATNQYALSAFVQGGTSTVSQFSGALAAFSGGGYANFNLSTGTVASTGGTLASSGVQFKTGSWNRNYISAIATSTTTNGNQVFQVNNNSALSRGPSYSGSGIIFYVWGLQFEQSSFPTSYIPTTSAAATRAADVPTATGSLATALAAGPWAYSFTSEATFVTSCTTGAAGAFTWPTGGWMRSIKVYTAGTANSQVVC